MADQAALFQLISNPPPWVNEAFFLKALQEYEKDKDLKITSFSIVPAGKPGDNFASIVFRAAVSYTSRSKTINGSYIVKVEPFLDGPQKEMMGCGSQFETEISMYTKTIPAMQHLLKGVGDSEIIAPNLIYSSLDPKIMIIQDISPEFVMDKNAQNLDAVQKVLKKLAKFHALSFFLNENHDETIENYNEPFLSEKMKNTAFILQAFGGASMVFKGWGKDMEKVADRIAAFTPNVLPKLYKIFSKGSGYNVLNHGDFHVRNIMFNVKEEPEKIVQDIQFIDFQFCFYGSPAVDLFWVLYFVASTEVRDQHRDQLVKLYHDEFVAVLNKLGYLKPIPTLLDLNVELLKNGLLEAYAAITALPIFFVDIQALMVQIMAEQGLTQPPGVEEMMKMGAKLMEAPAMKEVYMKLLPNLLYKGVFDA